MENLNKKTLKEANICGYSMSQVQFKVLFPTLTQPNQHRNLKNI